MPRLDSDIGFDVSVDMARPEGGSLRIAAVTNVGEGTLEEALAAAVRSAYVDIERIRTAAADAQDLGGFDNAEAQELVDSVIARRIPTPGASAIPHFEVTRSELGEILALLCMQDDFSVLVPAPRVRFKEATELATRGVDIVGVKLDGDLIEVWLGEVKVSTEDRNPPKVVDTGNSCLVKQLDELKNDRERVINQLAWMLDKSNDRDEMMIAAEATRRLDRDLDGIQIVLLAKLVRPENLASESDFGPFADMPGALAGERVEFCVATLVDDPTDLADRIYRRASEAQ